MPVPAKIVTRAVPSLRAVHTISNSMQMYEDGESTYRKNPHSFCVGCQWSSRIAPGSTVTSATAICVETLNTVESAIFAVPPEYCVGVTFENAYENGSGIWPCGSETGCWLSGGGTGSPSQYPECHLTGVRALTAREDVQLLAGDVVPVGDVVLEVLCDDLLGDVRHPVREQQRVVIVEGTIREDLRVRTVRSIPSPPLALG